MYRAHGDPAEGSPRLKVVEAMKVVTEMAPSASQLLLPPRDFDGFLFAPVGDDDKGMMLTVLSALARLDFDPWQEAARLAGLPRQAAKDELAAAIATLPGVPAVRSNSSTIADRLIALLPAKPPTQASAVGIGAVPGLGLAPIDFRSPRFLISLAIFAAMALSPLVFAPSRQSSPDGAAAPISGPVTPQTSVRSDE